jgi:imidazolonepropionase-like amidohydrolase
MMTALPVYRLPPTLLPEGEQRDLWIADGRFTDVPQSDAEALPGRYALPGFVDAHAHLAMSPDGPGGLELVEHNLRTWRDQGVLAIRDVGAPRSVTLELRPDPSDPQLFLAGRWHAPAGRFFPELHDPVAPEDLVASALREIERGATWIKVVADFRDEALSYDRAHLERLVEAVHKAGARVAAHSNRSMVADVVAAGVDSIEHGSVLDREALNDMAQRGTAWTPTLTALNAPLPDDLAPERRERVERIRDNVRSLLPVAHNLGIRILAGTDTSGTIVDEIRWLIDYGLQPVDALTAASTAARTFLGLASLGDGATADVVTFDGDPRDGPEVLAYPAAIVRAGHRVR